MVAVAVVMLLAVFSASPPLHAWLHSHDGTHQAKFGGHDQPAPGQDDDDGCAIVIFANGVVAAIVAILAPMVTLRRINLVAVGGAEVFRQVPRYWLPPLCGPPLS